MQHPDPDLLVGWAEGHLLAAESVELEAHLAACAECRELVAELGPRELVAADSAPLPDAFREAESTLTARQGRNSWLRSLMSVAVAAVVIIAVSLFALRERPVHIERLAVAPSLEELQGATRSAASDGSQLYVAVQVDSPSHLHLVAVLADGSVLTVPLDTQGNSSLQLDADVELSLGPYPRALAGVNVTYLIVIASRAALAEEWFDAYVELEVTSLTAFAQRIASEHDATVSTIAID